MKTILSLLACFIISAGANSQEYKDTSFTVNGISCTCKYNYNIADDVMIYDRFAKPASYPGGDKAWDKFVKKNIEKGFKGKHTVELRFQVDKNGDMSDFILQNKAPNVKYEEVLRVLKLSGKWFPSISNGFCVKSYVRLSLDL